MQYTELIEARRRLTQARTFHKRLVEKNAKAEADYLEKIERLQANVDQLAAESK